MIKDEYIIMANKIVNENSRKILLDQINNYYIAKNDFKPINHTYKVGDDVQLEEGTLLHGTYKNIDGLKEIIKNGLISSWFIDGRQTKYPSSVGLWNLNQDYLLKDYIKFYSGGTIGFQGPNQKIIKVINYDQMSELNNLISSIKDYHLWYMEQTKEARFLPSLVQDNVQIGIIFNGTNPYIKELKKGDILSLEINDEDVKEFVHKDYYDKFILERKNKDAFFTDREMAILYGIPSSFIEGILVGRNYEKNKEKLDEIKQILPNIYICNLDGKVIVE